MVVRLPYVKGKVLCTALAKGCGHNYYGEPAWPNDILYIFPVCILGTISFSLGLGIIENQAIGEPANPFATPLEILPEWYFFPTFNILRVLPDKLLGVLSLASVPLILITSCFIENINRFQNPFRRPVANLVFLTSWTFSLWLGVGSVLPISESLPFWFL